MFKKISTDKLAKNKRSLVDLDNIGEKRTVSIQCLLKPSEKKHFLSLIGRETESNAVRNLILDFLNSKNLN